MRWQDKLTKKEMRHLRTVANCTTLIQVKTTIEDQAKAREKSLADGLPIGVAEPCWECRNIGRKLGLTD